VGKGRWSNEDVEFLKKNINRIPLEEIALELGRSFEAIVTKKEEIYGEDPTQKQIQSTLQSSPEWLQLREELMDDELKYFEHRFSKIMTQFYDDILPTEETQIFLLIKFEILMSRNMKERKKALSLFKGLEKKRLEFIKSMDPHNPSDAEEARRLNDDIRSLETSQSTYTKEYTDLQDKHASILKNLKATRDQRIQNVENRKKNFIDIIKSLEEKEYREEQGKFAEMMKKATLKEKKRLSEYHQFNDTIVDKPLFNADTVDA
jgi:hypothetical protein